ncbi:histone H3-K4 methyltransferase Set1 [Saccharata proteae CBS 121410]|uniref:Histone-lysine N-methyltransferase, H3 lysine-4 specific n=1 Tax=Saccharata proteae CBS 121410 TaxID=1314787 RepID=A0A9P4HQJ2_9PEZI|nr:histone H3-K4 methyltransferase Set1 [Saccharata proteae CBS 121410]
MSSYAGTASTINALTPLTNTESSPPGKTTSPRPSRSSLSLMPPGSHASAAPPHNASHDDAAVEDAITPAHTPPQSRRQARPGPGKPIGYKVIYDPMLDAKLPKEQRKGRLVQRPIEDGNEAAPPDPRLLLAGYTTGKYNHGKARRRIAPYAVKQYAHDKNTVGPKPATRILVTELDPFTPESMIRTLFGSYGEIAELDHKIDPETGSFLGICSIRYKDSKPYRGTPISAAAAAKAAEKQGNGQRIQLREIKVELDREGRRCARAVDAIMSRKKAKEAREAAAQAQATKPITPKPALAYDGPPPDAPKGPSGKGARPPPPDGMRGAMAPMPVKPLHPAHALVEVEPIIDKIKRAPYIFLAHCYVPVLGTTIAHLKKRLKLYHWEDIRCDRTGYFIIFPNSRRGEDEAERCFRECNMHQLFTYTMNMECQKYGNPNYERSPSPERVLAEKRKREEEESIRREDEADLEREKKERAENLDPVRAALERLQTELCEQIMSDIKTRIAVPMISEYLDPARHAAKRRKLGIADPASALPKAPIAIFNAPEEPTQKHKGFHGGAGSLRKKMAAQKVRNREVNAFQDERRKKLPPKKAVVRSLHRRMASYDDEDSEDEQRSTVTRDTEEQDSRSISRMGSPTPDDEVDDMVSMRASKRRRLEPSWGDADTQDAEARRLYPHLINKDPMQMALRELEQVLSAFPKTSELYRKASTERRLRKLEEEGDALFFGGGVKYDGLRAGSVPTIDISLSEDVVEETPAETPEPEDATVQLDVKKKPKTTKKKAPTKKQLLLEQQAKIAEQAQMRVETVEEVHQPPKVVDIIPEETVDEDPIWGFTFDEPRSTVDETIDYILDIDGLQHTVKDSEDLRFLQQSLIQVRPAAWRGHDDVNLHAYREKHVKKLNTGLEGIAYEETKIKGYYRPNPTGSARTEGVKKIREDEKSKYLPHRIRVQKAREEREALAAGNTAHGNKPVDPAAATEAAKLAAAAKVASTANSRHNRANNRRLANEVSAQKQASADGDAIRFNQLKKRKKLVKFDRSAIHNWGLYAQENISANDMIIEYVGEKVRQKVADIREQRYDKQGVGSSYLFRIDEDSVVDATKKGGIARFINHSCVPNCTAKIIRVDDTKRIVIYALRDIAMNEELTYDYKFEREMDSDDRIPCLCGSERCKGFLN